MKRRSSHIRLESLCAACRQRQSRARPAWLLLFVPIALLAGLQVCQAQVNYVARFTPEKQSFLLGEPIFCDFTIENTGTQAFAFSYRTPSRALSGDLETEPHFRVTDAAGHPPPDPAPKPCGGAPGTVVYGSATLPPGQKHSERWLLNQWARFLAPGRYRVRAERRLPLMALDSATQKFSERPAAYAMAINEFSFDVVPSTETQLRDAFQPYVKMLQDQNASNVAEGVLVLTTLPQPFSAKTLQLLAHANSREGRWDRQQVLEGLARLDTSDAWQAILQVARGSGTESVRAYALLLLAEKGDKTFLVPLLEMIRTASPTIRGDILRSLGFFHDPRANRVLFERLHSKSPTDRMNAILGLKNLESREAIPALLAMLNDPAPQVRQVANFALQSLTGQPFQLSAKASRQESARAAEQWHAWWQQKGANSEIRRQPTCHDW